MEASATNLRQTVHIDTSNQTELQMETAKARAAVPAGYRVVETGAVLLGDKLWTFGDERFVDVAVPKPFAKGQKRPGWAQKTEAGMDVKGFICVVRKSS